MGVLISLVAIPLRWLVRSSGESVTDLVAGVCKPALKKLVHAKLSAWQNWYVVYPKIRLENRPRFKRSKFPEWDFKLLKFLILRVIGDYEKYTTKSPFFRLRSDPESGL
jgi:hypothetical protein